ncbi:MAG: monovalent cation/H(+) antiporter subunit G [Aeromicrobium erythreum]
MLLALALVGFLGSVSIARFAARDIDAPPGGRMTTDLLVDVASGALLLLGSALALVAAIGLVRFPDVLTRMHAATKPQTLGLLMVLAGLALRVRDPRRP